MIRNCSGSSYEDYPGTTFTEESDNFALAIHCFRMLRNGAHPYICERHLTRGGSAPAPISMDTRVERGETPFYTNVPGYLAPSYAPENDSFPQYLNDLWYKAFVVGHANPKARPNAAQWKAALLRFKTELVQCPDDSNHQYWKGYSRCPYCEADERFLHKVTPVVKRTPPIINSGGSIGGKLRHRGNSIPFWIVTIFLTFAVQMSLSLNVIPYLIDGVLPVDSIRYSMCCQGGLIVGFLGMFFFNTKLAPGRIWGDNQWWEYIVSVIMSMIWSVGFTVIVMIVSAVSAVFLKAILAMAIIGTVVGEISG